MGLLPRFLLPPNHGLPGSESRRAHLSITVCQDFWVPEEKSSLSSLPPPTAAPLLPPNNNNHGMALDPFKLLAIYDQQTIVAQHEVSKKSTALDFLGLEGSSTSPPTNKPIALRPKAICTQPSASNRPLRSPCYCKASSLALGMHHASRVLPSWWSSHQASRVFFARVWFNNQQAAPNKD